MDLLKSFITIMSNKVESDILKFKKKIAFNTYIILGSSDEVVLFKSVLRKEILDSDDINDLLLCYSDHIMDDFELLEFITMNKHIFYEMDEAVFNADIRNLIIKYLLQSNDNNIIFGLLKLFGTELIGINSPYTLYDLYLVIQDIIDEKDIKIRKGKAIKFMMNYSIRPFLEIFRSLNIEYSDIEKYILESEELGIKFFPDNIALLLDNKLIIEDRKLGNDYLVKRVITEYKKYSKEHITFNLNEFINYYNSTFNDDFSCFYYNKKNAKLDVELLISILSRNDEYEDSFMIYGEYLDRFRSLNDINYMWQENLSSFFNTKLQVDNDIKRVLVECSSIIENLKNGIDVTLEYYVYLNVPLELRDAFMKVLRWYMNNDSKYFGRNIFFNTDEQKDNTFKMILSSYKEDIFNNFMNRKLIHKEYLAFIRRMTSTRYISVGDWNDYLYSVTREYYIREGLIHFNAMNELLDNGETLLNYQIENFSLTDLQCMTAALRYAVPEMDGKVKRVKTALDKEIYDSVMTNRLYIEDLILERHSGIIREFINSECSNKVSFVKSLGISGTRFDRAIQVVRDKNPELYEQYSYKVSKMISSKTCFIGTTLKKN